ncbi:Hypothetical protein R9X50_00511500 [Acrodontium crateriforme]|uniref:Maleylacetate reductase n=1 Tax=Acrodontium crateriforme TaxID=150365 RepID=A0AAQ3M6J5_9PEZI|nr:Hypothetical protein R9X50_00511500 [Acrodontium crateriforme]
MDSFIYASSPSRVIFGRGSITTLGEELKRLGKEKPLFVTTPRGTQTIPELEQILTTASLASAGVFGEATLHTPVEITAKALEYLHAVAPDCIVSFGGGSAVGLGKALSVRTGLPHVSVPTTYSGSEMTGSLGETRDGRKTTRSEAGIRPAVVIYDVDLTLSLPVATSATSGVNAIAHAVEALYAPDKNPIIEIIALEGIKALAAALPAIISSPADIEARSKALYGAWLCATCAGSTRMGLHHKLCHTLGGSFGLPHAETHTIVLPHSIAYNAPSVPDAMGKLTGVLPGSDGDAIRGLNLLLKKLKVKTGLKDFGMKEDDVPKAAEIAMTSPYANPREIELKSLTETIRRCWAGEEARVDL